MLQSAHDFSGRETMDTASARNAQLLLRSVVKNS